MLPGAVCSCLPIAWTLAIQRVQTGMKWHPDDTDTGERAVGRTQPLHAEGLKFNPWRLRRKMIGKMVAWREPEEPFASLTILTQMDQWVVSGEGS